MMPQLGTLMRCRRSEHPHYKVLTHHQVRRLVGALRPAGRAPGAGAPGSARDAPLVEAARALVALFAEHPARRSAFLAEDGAVALIELLEERSHKVGPRSPGLCSPAHACAQPQQPSGPNG